MNRSDLSILIIHILFVITIWVLATTRLNDNISSKIKTTSSVNIINETNYDINKLLHIIFSNVIIIEDTNVKIEYLTQVYEDSPLGYGAITYPNILDGEGYIIAMSRHIRPSQMKIILLHEIIHIQQFESNRLQVIDYKYSIYSYDGILYDLNVVPYLNRKFETEAYSEQEIHYLKLDSLLCNTPNL